ncbi:MAG: response regulator transcription factor [Lachnospiraceae bacterium]|nr:response regulator transcription factor [Lachnospiraceae bacterium]
MKHIVVYNNQTGIMDALSHLFFTEDIEIVTAEEDGQLLEQVTRADMIIVDSFLEETEVYQGLQLIRQLRSASALPIIVVSAPVAEHIKIEALGAGADDYVTMDMNPLELLARVKMHLSRYTQLVEMQRNISRIYRMENLVLNDSSRTVTVAEEEIELTPIEYKILRLLMVRRGHVLSANEIYEAIWQAPPLGAGNTIPVHIRHIREKIEDDPKKPKYVKAVWGLGYKIG